MKNYDTNDDQIEQNNENIVSFNPVCNDDINSFQLKNDKVIKRDILNINPSLPTFLALPNAAFSIPQTNMHIAQTE